MEPANVAHKCLSLFQDSGYHIIVLQEASGRVREWPQEGWQQCLRRNQLFAIREPGQLQSITSRHNRSLQWHVSQISITQKLAGLSDILVVSLCT